MLKLSDITLARGARVLLKEASLTVFPGHRVGLVGANGAGKSSLFALVLGELHQDAGEVELPARRVISHVAQELVDVDRDALDFVMDGDTELRAVEGAIREAEVFDSAISAVDFAVESQVRLEASQTDVADARRFRIGLHMGEVYRSSGDVFGHAINIAARIEGLAEPGSVCVSHEVYRAAHQRSEFGFVSGGRVTLRNIPEPLSIYHVRPNGIQPMDRAASRLHIATMDGFPLTVDDAEPLSLRSQKARALIGFLALSNRFRENQDRIVTLLWPDRSRLKGGAR